MPEYEPLTKRQKNNLEQYGIARTLSWHKLLEQSVLQNEIYRKLYSLLSSYAHSEFLSIIQLNQSNLNVKSVDTIRNTNVSLNTTKQILSVLIEWTANRFEPAKEVLNKCPLSLMSSITIWSGIAKGKRS